MKIQIRNKTPLPEPLFLILQSISNKIPLQLPLPQEAEHPVTLWAEVESESFFLSPQSARILHLSFPHRSCAFPLPLHLQDIVEFLQGALLAIYPLDEDMYIDTAKMALYVDEQKVPLTKRDIDILLFLAQEKTPCSQKRLLQKIWHIDAEVHTHSVENHLYRLRQKLERHYLGERMKIEKKNDGYLLHRLKK